MSQVHPAGRCNLIRAAVLLIGSVLASGASAQSFTAINKLAVVPLDSKSMEVVDTQRTGARGIWCAAADYVRRQLGNPKRAQIYITVPRGASRTVRGATGTSFTIARDAQMAQLKPSFSAATDKAGTNLSVAVAYKYCVDANEKNKGGDR